MIPRSIWRWRKTDPADRRSDRNLCSCSLSVLFLPRRKSRSREKNGGDCKLCESAVFHYTHYNESSESKSLLRAIESARQMSTNIDMEIENGGQLSRDFLKENLQTLWVDGIIVLDAEGKTDCEYSTDESLANEITEYLQKEIIMDFAGYEERSYSERFTREDGSFIDIAACARKDAPGIVAIYYYTSPEFARNYTLTIQGLLNGYSIQKDGTIIVADDGIVVASNNESLLGQNTADNEVVQAMKKHTDSQHIYHFRKEGIGCYGIMLKQRDYYIYAYLPDTEVFCNLPLSVIGVIFLYFLMSGIFWFWTYRTNLAYRKQEFEKDEKYKAELLTAAKKAEAANEAKTEFLQRISHDIRTPINGILGLLEIGDHFPDDMEKQSECRKKIRGASGFLFNLVNDVLDMSKMESGEIIIEEVPFSLKNILDEIVELIEVQAVEQGLQFDAKCSADAEWNLIGSPVHLHQILVNIAGNAVKYSRKNGYLHLSCYQISADEDTAIFRFVCEDNGVGMSKEFQEHMFEPFTQEEDSPRTKLGGTGLGLSIVKKLLEKMDGTIEVASERGKGSKFMVTIPFQIDRLAKEKETKENVQKDLRPLQDMCILLVEDNELNMEIAEFILEDKGASIIKAWNGKEAVDIFEASELDGCNSIKRFFYITLPLIRPILAYTLITSIIGGLQMFDVPQILTNGQGNPDRTSMTLIMFLNSHLKSKNYGMAGALSVYLFIVSGILCMIVYKMTNDTDPDGSKKAAKKKAKEERRRR